MLIFTQLHHIYPRSLLQVSSTFYYTMFLPLSINKIPFSFLLRHFLPTLYNIIFIPTLYYFMFIHTLYYTKFPSIFFYSIFPPTLWCMMFSPLRASFFLTLVWKLNRSPFFFPFQTVVSAGVKSLQYPGFSETGHTSEVGRIWTKVQSFLANKHLP